jgi:hypothetical protein
MSFVAPEVLNQGKPIDLLVHGEGYFQPLPIIHTMMEC